jgi:phage terminase small subunit
MTSDVTRSEQWKAAVLERWEISEAGSDLLRLAGEALDRAEAAEVAIAEHGVLIDGLHGKKANPAVAIKRDATAEFLRLVAALGLDPEEARDAA